MLDIVDKRDELRAKLKVALEAAKAKRKRVKPYRKPRYDEVFYEGLAWLEECAKYDYPELQGIAMGNSDFVYPKDATGYLWRKIVTDNAKEKVDKIAEVAKSKGWKDRELYQTRSIYPYPAGKEWGLICHLEEDDVILDVTFTHIDICSKDWLIYKFYPSRIENQG